MNRFALVAASLAAGVAAALFVPAVARAQTPFSDVPAGHWAAQSIAALAQRGIVQGRAGSGTAAAPAYAGNKPVTRYEMAVTLYRFVQYMERADQQKRGNTRVQALPPIKNNEGALAVRRLVAGGYLPAATPFGTNGAALATADQFADALARIVQRRVEKRTPVSPDSQNAPDAAAHPAHKTPGG